MVKRDKPAKTAKPKAREVVKREELLGKLDAAVAKVEERQQGKEGEDR